MYRRQGEAVHMSSVLNECAIAVQIMKIRAHAYHGIIMVHINDAFKP